ncbi:hypothetical protein V6N11_077195 [Hibiscus sabdariffa]|uniref:Uncharacterized protein n=1 Tax=Hibiscus sabdariffa TaxID=183260 RepID=A0ABR2TCC0_9ROSI
MQKLTDMKREEAIDRMLLGEQGKFVEVEGDFLMQDLMGSSELSRERRQLLTTSVMCQEEITKIVDDTNIATTRKPTLASLTLEAVLKQVMLMSQECHVLVWRRFEASATPPRFFDCSSVAFRVIPQKECIGTKMHMFISNFGKILYALSCS